MNIPSTEQRLSNSLVYTAPIMKIGIVGCGIAGSFVAYFLKNMGLDVVCLSEKRTYPTVGLIQSLMQKFPEDIEMARRTREIYIKVSKEFEIENALRFVRSYTVILKERENILNNLIPMWRSVGAEVKKIEDLKNNEVPFRVYDNEIVAECTNDVLVRIDKIVDSLWKLLNVRKVKVVAIKEENDNVKIITEKGDSVTVDKVVIACGAWTRKLLLNMGLRQVPYVPYKCQAGLFALSTSDDMYILYDYVNKIYVRPAPHIAIDVISKVTGLKIMIAGNGNTPPIDPDLEDEDVEDWFRTEIEPKLKRRFEKVRYIMGHAGFCDVTPDSKPAIGKLQTRVFIISGFDGYGAEVGPAVAQALAKLVVEKKLDSTEERYLLTRFGSGFEEKIPEVEAHEL